MKKITFNINEELYLTLNNLVKREKISKWINENIHEKIISSEKNEMSDLVNGYIAMSNNKDLSIFSDKLLEESLRKTYE